MSCLTTKTTKLQIGTICHPTPPSTFLYNSLTFVWVKAPPSLVTGGNDVFQEVFAFMHFRNANPSFNQGPGRTDFDALATGGAPFRLAPRSKTPCATCRISISASPLDWCFLIVRSINLNRLSLRTEISWLRCGHNKP
jgi:hypothetical protein